MSFSAEWLALREPVDRAARSPETGTALQAHFHSAKALSVVDLGCGTGSNLRGIFHLLPARQSWLLVDYDPALLAAARGALMAWADASRLDGETLQLEKNARTLTVRFRQADLAGGAGKLLDEARADLVTASALFDLISAEWIGQFARDVAAHGAAFFTSLTYDGRDRFRPGHRMDAAISAAFASHQGGDKGFGPAAGPDAPAALAQAFRSVSYTVSEGDSPWRVDRNHAEMARQLLIGIAGAVRETGRLPDGEIVSWLAYRLASLADPEALLQIGHTDTFARPR